tara:strand:+ start:584 stop:844 length:261 start_codon:yes stop_codon:yes gene_type:complete
MGVLILQIMSTLMSGNWVGEKFMGHAWAQNGEAIIIASIQRIYIKLGAVFKMNTLVTSNGKFAYALGSLNFVEKALSLKAVDLVLE